MSKNKFQKEALVSGEYNLNHTKVSVEERKSKKKQKQQPPQGFTNEEAEKGLYNDDQKNGQFSFDTIHGMPLKEVTYTIPTYEERRRLREEFHGVYNEDNTVQLEQGVRGKFLQHLADNFRDDLKEKLGFSDTEIDEMAKNGYAPNGYNVHHKIPLHGGGKNEFENFILAPVGPHDQWHKDVMDPQLLGVNRAEPKTVLIPYCEDMIYDPKKFGYTKNNEKVEPNYQTVIDLKNYSDNYLPEHVADIRKQKGLTSSEQEKPKKTKGLHSSILKQTAKPPADISKLALTYKKFQQR